MFEYQLKPDAFIYIHSTAIINVVEINFSGHLRAPKVHIINGKPKKGNHLKKYKNNKNEIEVGQFPFEFPFSRFRLYLSERYNYDQHKLIWMGHQNDLEDKCIRICSCVFINSAPLFPSFFFLFSRTITWFIKMLLADRWARTSVFRLLFLYWSHDYS